MKSIRQVVSILDEVPEALREFYHPLSDGRFALDLEEDDALKGALRKEREKRLRASDRASQLEEQLRKTGAQPPPPKNPLHAFFDKAEDRLVGLDAEARAAELAKIEAEGNALADRLVAEQSEQLEAKANKLRDSLRSTMLRVTAQRLSAELAKHGHIDVLLPHVASRLDVEEATNGEFVVHARDATGNRITLDAFSDQLRADVTLAPVLREKSATEVAAYEQKVRAALGLQ